MRLRSGEVYRAKTAAGDEITFTVLETPKGVWITVDLDEGGVPEPNVWLNTNLLLWISSKTRRAAIRKAADEVIEALEKNAQGPR